MSSSKRKILAGAGALAVSSLLLTAFLLYKPPEVSVIAKAPTVEKRSFDYKTPPAEAGKNDSATIYKYVCDSEISYSIEQENKDEKMDQLRIKVTGVRVTLNLPIVVLISSRAAKGKDEFEEGHVTICKRIYYEAHAFANKAAHSVIGRTFYGEAPTTEKALQNALSIAQQEVRGEYQERIESKTKSIFSIYDFYAQAGTDSTLELVDKAIKYYEMGKPRRLSTPATTNVGGDNYQSKS